MDTAGEKGILVKEADAGGYLLEPVDAEMAGQTNPIQPVITPAEAQACPEAEPQRVKVGTTIRVCTQSDRVVVRDVPQIEGMINFRIYKGTEALIVDGPVCANNSSWWKVKVSVGTKVYKTSDIVLSQDEEGWVREGSDEVDRYFICPVDK